MAAKSFSFLAALVICLVFSTCTAKDALYSGERLTAGQILINGFYFLTMQYDCNLVLTAIVPLWSSGTARQGVNCYAALENDGEFLVYNGTGAPLWTTNTTGVQGSYILSLQPDRNLAIYGPRLWATNTAAPLVASGKRHH